MTPRSILVAVVAALVGLVAMGEIVVTAGHAVRDPQDLRAFYCGGKVLAAHANPYLAEPLRACELAAARAAGLSPYPGLAIPSPLPAFALLPFALLGLLPFALATGVYALLALAALIATGVLLVKLTGVPAYAVFAALVLGDGLVSILNGQIVPFAILALCAAASELRAGRPRLAGVYASLAAIEPHLALPAIAALAIAVPRSRAIVGAMLGAFAIVTVVAAGPAAALQYVTAVLPAQARSEIFAGDQYGFAALFSRLGAAPAIALTASSLLWVLTVCAGMAIAIVLARRTQAPEVLVLLPPAIALLGGPYVHLVQMAAAVPALLVCSARLPALRTQLVAALALVAVPWRDLVADGTAAALVATVAVTAAIAFGMLRGPVLRPALLTAALALVALGESALLAGARHGDPAAAIAAAAGPQLLAEASWSAYIAATSDPSFARFAIGALPTWTALLLLAGVTARGAMATAEPAATARPGD